MEKMDIAWRFRCRTCGNAWDSRKYDPETHRAYHEGKACPECGGPNIQINVADHQPVHPIE